MALLKATRKPKQQDCSEQVSAPTPSRLHPTAADAIVAGVAPGLIIGMICCLVFFLITITCRGGFTIRLMYILGLFTFASVMVARIAIEQSRTLSMTYMGILGGATLLVVMRFVQFPGALAILALPLTIMFLALIGFLADRITFDCTLIDDTEDSSGVGLLQSLGLVDNPQKSSKRKRRHNPGVWVLYFALLAIPLFGIGQMAIPAEETGSRRAAYWFLFGYLFFSLGLLISTSFLGLRRYLRQRTVEMPASLNMIWIGGGIAGVTLVLLVVSLLPLPSGSQGLLDLPFRIETATGLRPSPWGWGKEGKKEEPGDSKASSTPGNQDSKKPSEATARGGKDPSNEKGDTKSKSLQNDPKSKDSESTDEKGDSKKTSSNESESQSKEKNAEPSKNPSKEQNPEKSKAQQPSRDQKSDDQQKPSEREKKDSQASSKAPSQTTNSGRSWSVSLSGGLGNLSRWIVSGLLLLVIVYATFYYREELNQAWRDFAAWWRGLFGDRSEDATASEATSMEVPSEPVILKPFNEFANPFSKTTSGWNATKVVRHTFEAIEAWGRERQLSRSAQETPEEYLYRLIKAYPDQTESLHRLVNLYNRLAYANATADVNEVKRLSTLWDWLTTRHV